MTTADDILKRADQLSTDRSYWERVWKDIADYAEPTQSRALSLAPIGSSGIDRLIESPSSREASKKRFDSTAMIGLDRLSSGIESIITPLAEKWHGLDIDDPFAPESTDEERDFLERLRDFQFAMRYDARSGFMTANQKAIRSTIAYGTGVVFTEEGFGDGRRGRVRAPVLYRHIPISQSYIAVNAQGVPDTVFRTPAWSARALVERFGDKVSAKVKDAANDPRRMDEKIDIIHAVFPREEGKGRGGVLGANWASYYIERDTKHLIGESGFYEFPFHVYYWSQTEESGYGESPLMLALDDIRGINVIRRDMLIASSQSVRPALAVASDGVMNRPNLNPGATNVGAIDSNGRLRIQPIVTAPNAGLAGEIVERERVGIREQLFLNLFQVLVDKPEITATEAMLRANEKGELLGPAGAKIQAALSSMIDREIGILQRKGAFEKGGSLEIPDTMVGRDFAVRFTSPLDRTRQAKEGQAIAQAYQFAGQIAAAKGDPSVFDNLDDDEAMKFVSRVFGAPEKIIVNQKDRDAVRDARAQEAAAAKNIAATKELAQAAGAAAPALEMAMGGGQQNVAPLPLPALAPAPV